MLLYTREQQPGICRDDLVKECTSHRWSTIERKLYWFTFCSYKYISICSNVTWVGYTYYGCTFIFNVFKLVGKNKTL